MELIERTFGQRACLLGVIHLPPLPGSPRWGGDAAAVTRRALADVETVAAAGFDGLILENYGDVPFARGFAGRGAVAGLAAVGARVAEAVGIPIGVNVLRNDARSAVAVAAAIGARFIRVNVHVGAAVTDQGIIQGDAFRTMNAIRDAAPGLLVFADVFVKHATPLGDATIEEAAADTVERGLADVLIVTGRATGSPAALEDASAIKKVVPGVPVLIGSGVTAESAARVLGAADGVIVGSAIMRGGKAAGSIDPERARAFVAAAGRARG